MGKYRSRRLSRHLCTDRRGEDKHEQKRCSDEQLSSHKGPLLIVYAGRRKYSMSLDWLSRKLPDVKSVGSQFRAAARNFLPVGTWLSLVEHSLGVRGVGSSNL